MADLSGMRNEKIKAAKRLTDALENDLDFAMYLDGHPNENRAMTRLMKDISNSGTGRYKGIPHVRRIEKRLKVK